MVKPNRLLPTTKKKQIQKKKNINVQSGNFSPAFLGIFEMLLPELQQLKLVSLNL